jgi:hypothetical protein
MANKASYKEYLVPWGDIPCIDIFKRDQPTRVNRTVSVDRAF